MSGDTKVLVPGADMSPHGRDRFNSGGEETVLRERDRTGRSRERYRNRTESVSEFYTSMRVSLADFLGTDVPDVRTRDFWVNLAQILLYVAIFIFGLMVCLPIGILTRDFNGECVLYSQMRLLPLTNGSLLLDADSGATSWGSIEQCYVCTFSGAFACIFAIVWFWFFLLCTEKQKGPANANSSPEDLKLLIPTVLATSAMAICMMVVACVVSAGFDAWCTFIHADNNGLECDSTANYDWVGLPKGRYTYSYLRLATAGSWLLFLTLAISLGYTTYRLVVYATAEIEDTSKPKAPKREVIGYLNPNYDGYKQGDSATPSGEKNPLTDVAGDSPSDPSVVKPPMLDVIAEVHPETLDASGHGHPYAAVDDVIRGPPSTENATDPATGTPSAASDTWAVLPARQSDSPIPLETWNYSSSPSEKTSPSPNSKYGAIDLPPSEPPPRERSSSARDNVTRPDAPNLSSSSCKNPP